MSGPAAGRPLVVAGVCVVMDLSVEHPVVVEVGAQVVRAILVVWSGAARAWVGGVVHPAAEQPLLVGA